MKRIQFLWLFLLLVTSLGACAQNLPSDGQGVDARPLAGEPSAAGVPIVCPFRKEECVYFIETAGDLALLSKLVNEGGELEPGVRAQDASYRLENDVDLSQFCTEPGGWTPIGRMTWGNSPTQDFAFSGTFDGGGRIVRGLSINRPGETADEMFQGLFGYTYSARIENLEVEDCYINAGSHAGGVAGGMFSYWGIERENQTQLRNCRVSGEIIVCDGNAGGVVGVARRVENCGFEGKITCKGQGAGGIAARAADIQSCYANAVIFGEDFTGGVVGDALRVKNSYFLGSVSGTKTVGGVAAFCSQVTGCYSSADVGANSQVGSIAGLCTEKINLESAPVSETMRNCLAVKPYVLHFSSSPENKVAIGGYLGEADVGSLYYVKEDLTGCAPQMAEGNPVPLAALSEQEQWERILMEPGEAWGAVWKSLQPGSFPQLIWQEAPAAPLPQDPVSIWIVKQGDCLWNIALQLYGDGNRFVELYELNREIVGANPNLINPGQELIYR